MILSLSRIFINLDLTVQIFERDFTNSSYCRLHMVLRLLLLFEFLDLDAFGGHTKLLSENIPLLLCFINFGPWSNNTSILLFFIPFVRHSVFHFIYVWSAVEIVVILLRKYLFWSSLFGLCSFAHYSSCNSKTEASFLLWIFWANVMLGDTISGLLSCSFGIISSLHCFFTLSQEWNIIVSFLIPCHLFVKILCHLRQVK